MEMLHGFYSYVVLFFCVLTLETLQYIAVPKPMYVVFKCLPILNLVTFVYRQHNSFKNLKANKQDYRVFLALCISMLADGVLVYVDDIILFLGGLLLFLVAIVFYLFAFGLKTTKPWILLITFSVSLAVYYVIFEKLSQIAVELRVCCLVYLMIGQVTIWRVFARVKWSDVKKGDRTYLYAALGTVSFAISDTTLAVNKFAFEIPAATYIIMATYYLAQLLLAKTASNKQKLS